MNFFLGLPNTTIDLLDNPYVQVKAYMMNESYKLNNEVKLKQCEEKDFLKFMSPYVSTYYPNSVCLADKNEVVLNNNWFRSSFDGFMLVIE